MSRYDGLIIPRSYNEYINKTDPVAMSQALQLNGVMDAAPTSGSNKPAKSDGIYNKLTEKENVGVQTIVSKNNANICIPAQYSEEINYVAYGTDKNLPTSLASYFIRTERAVNFLVQFAIAVQSGEGTIEKDYIRKAWYTNNTWNFSEWIQYE